MSVKAGIERLLRVQVFARYPRPGQVKTRLIPAIGANTACALQLAMLRDLNARLSGFEVELWGTDEPDLPHYRDFCRADHRCFFRQPEGSLGQRMAFAVQSAQRRGFIPVLVGADCPWIDALTVYRIRDSLSEGADAVVVPALDGGYVAMALCEYQHSVFNLPSWGDESVFSRTLTALRCCRLSTTVLDPLPDIDEGDDLYHLQNNLNFSDNPAIAEWLTANQGLIANQG